MHPVGLYFINKPWYFPVGSEYWGCKRRNSQVQFGFKHRVKWGNVKAVEALEQQKDQGRLGW